MGLFDLFKRKEAGGRHRASEVHAHLLQTEPPVEVVHSHPARQPAELAPGGFAVLDVETTGLSPKGDRILEIAVVRTDQTGLLLDEWTSRFNPEGPVGATHIHGITQADVRDAPLFADAIPYLNWLLAGRAIAAHNARFDLAFLRSEYGRAGWALPWLPALCTLDASRLYLPQLARRRLPDCCWACGVPLEGAHSALGDARATAGLLGVFLDPARGKPPIQDHVQLPSQAMGAVWPTEPGGASFHPGAPSRPTRRTARTAPAPGLLRAMQSFRLSDAIDDGAPEGSLAYLELLAETLEDGDLTEQESAGLADMAGAYEFSPEDLLASHRGFLLALSHEAVADGRVAHAERTDLKRVAQLLEIPVEEINRVLDEADGARLARLSADLRPLPEKWIHGDPLRVGDRVVFTGCDEDERTRLERASEKAGVRVMSSVSGTTAMLVTDDPYSGSTKARAAAQRSVRVVQPDTYALLLKHLQPPTPRTDALVQPLQPASGQSASGHSMVDASPANVRAWAIANGFEVGVRGRVPRHLVDAYLTAHALGGRIVESGAVEGRAP